MGDFNFRLNKYSKLEVEQMMRGKQYGKLLQMDQVYTIITCSWNLNWDSTRVSFQMKHAQNEQLVFLDFLEGSIDFPASYKFDIGTNTYDSRQTALFTTIILLLWQALTSRLCYIFSPKQRIPAWCDRIVYFVQAGAFEGFDLQAKLEMYTSLQQYTCSDHKPVVATLNLRVSRTLLLSFQNIDKVSLILIIY